MQKRTNPLALKMDAASKQAANEIKQEPMPKVEQAAPVEAPSAKESVVPVVETVATPVEDKPAVTDKPAEDSKIALTKRRAPIAPVAPAPAEVSVEPQEEKRAEVKKEREIEKAAPVMGGAVQWQMVSSKKAEPQAEPEYKPTVASWTAPARVEVAPPVAEPEVAVEPEVEPETAEQLEDEIVDEDILSEEEAPASEESAPTAQPEHKPLSEDAILDEQLPPSIEDYEMAARFNLCGRVSRGMKMGKISRDVCRLAQLMHPNESLSSILEGALLTRIYLENRDAFDALAEMLEKKGGHIKC